MRKILSADEIVEVAKKSFRQFPKYEFESESDTRRNELAYILGWLKSAYDTITYDERKKQSKRIAENIISKF